MIVTAGQGVTLGLVVASLVLAALVLRRVRASPGAKSGGRAVLLVLGVTLLTIVLADERWWRQQIAADICRLDTLGNPLPFLSSPSLEGTSCSWANRLVVDYRWNASRLTCFVVSWGALAVGFEIARRRRIDLRTGLAILALGALAVWGARRAPTFVLESVVVGPRRTLSTGDGSLDPWAVLCEELAGRAGAQRPVVTLHGLGYECPPDAVQLGPSRVPVQAGSGVFLAAGEREFPCLGVLRLRGTARDERTMHAMLELAQLHAWATSVVAWRRSGRTHVEPRLSWMHEEHHAAELRTIVEQLELEEWIRQPR